MMSGSRKRIRHFALRRRLAWFVVCLLIDHRWKNSADPFIRSVWMCRRCSKVGLIRYPGVRSRLYGYGTTYLALDVVQDMSWRVRITRAFLTWYEGRDL